MDFESVWTVYYNSPGTELWQDELNNLGGLSALVPGANEPTLIRQHLDESLQNAFNCACKYVQVHSDS